MKTILLTGATGFLGSHILRRLVQNKEYTIIIIKRSFSDVNRIKDLLPLVTSIDIDKDNSFCEELFSSYSIDCIIHTATCYGRNGISITDILQSNLIFPLQLIEKGIENGLKLFINTDSYFNKPNQSYKTLLDYSLSKKSLNIWLDYLSRKVKVVNMRLEHLYGENDSDSKFVESMIQKIAIQQDPEVRLTYGQQKRDFVYVDDVVSAYECVLNHYENYFFDYMLFEIGTGDKVSIKDFVDEIASYSKSKSKLLYGSLEYREDEIMTSVADINPLRNWGWFPTVDYKTGLHKIIDSYRLMK